MSDSSKDLEPKGPGGSDDDVLETSSPTVNEGRDGLQLAVRWASVISLLLLIAFGSVYVVDRYISTGDQSPLEISIDELEEAVREDPSNPDARLALAEVYIADQRYEDALSQAGEVLDEYPGNERALLVSGIAHEAANQTDAAIAVLEVFVDLRKDLAMAHVDKALEAAYFYLGRSYLAADRPAEAVEALEAAMAISPVDADAMYQAGLAYQALGEYEQALIVFERATAFVPDFAEVYSAMAAGYAEVGDDQRQRYAEAMQLYSLDDHEAALPELLAVSEALPEFAPVFLGLALAQEKVGDVTAGISAAERALELRPDYVAAQQTLGRLMTQQEAGG